MAIAVVGWGAGLADQRRVRPDQARAAERRSIADLQALQKSTGVGGEIDVLVAGAAPSPTPRSCAGWSPTRARCSSTSATARSAAAAPPTLCPAFSLPDLFNDATNLTSAADRRRAAQHGAPVLLARRDRAPTAAARRSPSASSSCRWPSRTRCLQEMRAPAEPTRRRARRPRRPAGHRRGGQRRGVVAVAAAADARRRAGPRSRSAVRGLPALGAGARAPAADRPGHRLVGARALRPAHPAEPDVGDARARRSSRSPPSSACCCPSATGPSARAGWRRRDGARSGPTAPPGPPCSRPATTAIAGFAVLVVSDIRMLRDFGFVTVIDLTVALRGRDGRAPGGADARRAEAPAAAEARAARTGPARRRPRVTPQKPPPAPRLPAGASRYGWFVGVVAVPAHRLHLGEHACARAASPPRGLRRGSALPQFAAPTATGPVPDGDVNVARKAGQGDAGSRAACTVRGIGVAQPCDLVRDSPAARSRSSPTRGAQCTGEIDALARARGAPPRA